MTHTLIFLIQSPLVTKMNIFSRNQEQPKDLTEVQKAISAHEAESSEVEGRRNKFAQLHGS